MKNPTQQETKLLTEINNLFRLANDCLLDNEHDLLASYNDELLENCESFLKNEKENLEIILHRTPPARLAALTRFKLRFIREFARKKAVFEEITGEVDRIVKKNS